MWPRKEYHFSLFLLFSCSVVFESFVTPRTVALQTPLSMGFSGQDYWNLAQNSSSRNSFQLWDQIHVSISPALQEDSLPLSHQGRTPLLPFYEKPVVLVVLYFTPLYDFCSHFTFLKLVIAFKLTSVCTVWRRKWQPTSVFLPGKSHGQRILVGYSPWGREELDMTEHLALL